MRFDRTPAAAHFGNPRRRRDWPRVSDIGGGLAVTYDAEHPIDVEGFGAAAEEDREANRASSSFSSRGVSSLGMRAFSCTRVLYRKRSGGKEFIIIDAGMNDLLRPSHYNAYHKIEAVTAARAARSLLTLSDQFARAAISLDFTAKSTTSSRAISLSCAHPAPTVSRCRRTTTRERALPKFSLIADASELSPSVRTIPIWSEKRDSSQTGGRPDDRWTHLRYPRSTARDSRFRQDIC